MLIEDIIKEWGSGRKAATACGYNKSTVSDWKSYGYIPIKAQMRIEKLTNGKLKADTAHCERM